MKKSFLTLALLSAVAAVVFAGCSKSETPPTPDVPAAPSTNAPAPAK